MANPKEPNPVGADEDFQKTVIKTVVQIAIFASTVFFATSLFNYLRRGLHQALINAIASGTLLIISIFVLSLVQKGRTQLACRVFIVAGLARALHLLLIVPDNNFPVAVMYTTIFMIVSIFISEPKKGHYWAGLGFFCILAAIFTRSYSGIVYVSNPDPISLKIGNYFLPIIFALVITLLCFYIFQRFYTALGESAQARDRLEKTNKTLENFAYVASHDLQEPLRTVTCYAQLLAQDNEGKLSKGSDESIHFIVDGAQQMQRLIRDLLQYSRLKTQTPSFEPTDLNEILDRVIKNIKATLDSSGTILETAPLPTVKAQPSQMIQLFQNLISNAIKFHSTEIPRVTLNVKRQNSDWLFSVRDNGIGIADEDRVKIFQLFQRLHSQSKYAGSGMGLAICEEILVIHGGKIWVESIPGQGSTFFFTLPAAG